MRTTSARALFSGVTHRVPIFVRSVMRSSSGETVGVRVGSGGVVDVGCPGDDAPAQADVMDVSRSTRSILGNVGLYFTDDPFKEGPWLGSSGMEGNRVVMLLVICPI